LKEPLESKKNLLLLAKKYNIGSLTGAVAF